MLNHFSKEEKNNISLLVRKIDYKIVEKDYDKLIEIGKDAEKYAFKETGNKIIDYYTFTQRLETKGKYNCNYFDFLENIEEFKKKKFIQTMITFYEKIKTRNQYCIYKEIYNVCITSINVMRPLFCMQIYAKYNPKTVLNCCSGWGGSLVASCALNIEKYIGIEINHYLREPYENMISFLKKKSNTDVEMYFENALNFDYSKINYDLVFTSPPYYFLEKYENNIIYSSKKEMNEHFYIPLFTKTYHSLTTNGTFVINVCREIYEKVLIPLFGNAHEIIPYKKLKKRQSNYLEMAYIWKK